MPTTDLTASQLRARITALQLALGGPTRVQFEDAAVSYADDAAKLRAIGYYESLLAQVDSGETRRSRVLYLAPTSGIER